MTDNDFADRFAEALVSEIKAEMGRRSLSSRALGRLIGKSSQYMSDRLDGGNSKTGRRVVLSVWDVSAISHALDLGEITLVERAEAAASGSVVVGRFGVGAPLDDLGEVAASTSHDHEDDNDDYHA